MAKISAIVPTRDRPASVRALLQTLTAQRVDRGSLEVIVVDDGSEADIAAIVSRASAAGPVPVRCERQAPAGLNAARNLGAERAGGEVLAFLDDDTLASPGWAEALLKAFEDEGCAGVAGRVELRLDGPEPRWLVGNRSYLSEVELGPNARWLDTGPEPAGANCAVRRADFERLGGFASGLDREGASLISNGDTEFFRRLRGAGGRLRYVPDAHVVHCIPAERLTLEFFRRRAHAQGVSDELLEHRRRGAPTAQRRLREWVRLGRSLPIFARGVLRWRGTVNARLWIAYCRGRLAAQRRGRTPG
jgi:GT2 family glycosyltransferase